MIRINLLPSKKKKKALMIPPALIYGMASVVIVAIGVIVFTMQLNKKIEIKQNEIYTKQKTLKELQAALQDVRNLEKDNKEFREKTRIIEQLKKNQIVPLRLLDEVSEMLPKGVWLVGLTDKQSVVSIDGFAFSNSDLVAYVQSLKSSKYLTDVMLVESRQTELGDFSVYKFKLSLRVKV